MVSCIESNIFIKPQDYNNRDFRSEKQLKCNSFYYQECSQWYEICTCYKYEHLRLPSGEYMQHRHQLLFIVIGQMAAPNVLATDMLFIAQHSGAIYFVARYIKAKLLLYNIYI